MNDFRRSIYKIGITVPEIPHLAPRYFAWNYIGTSPCQIDYKPFNFSSPITDIERKEFIFLEGETNPPLTEPLFYSYEGSPYKYLEIISMTAIDIATNLPAVNLAKLYYETVEITSFPYTIDIEDVIFGEQSGLILLHQKRPLCGSGYLITINFQVTDVTGDLGPIRSCTVRITSTD